MGETADHVILAVRTEASIAARRRGVDAGGPPSGREGVGRAISRPAHRPRVGAVGPRAAGPSRRRSGAAREADGRAVASRRVHRGADSARRTRRRRAGLDAA